ncbi:hypothetical protein R9X47_18465 [Wukongibacter baidiensis]|uniref:hypothetical protein n=1 Tax=Wukongibacter baidiensis TaxID=1723361 RepID=UPI003D7FD0AB
MAELFDLRPEENVKNNEEKGNSLLDLGDNLLLPIIAVFLIGANNSNFPAVDNIKKVAKELISIPFNIDLSPQDVEVMQNAVNTVSPYMNPDNLVMLDKFSTFLSAMLKITAVKELNNNMARNSSDGSSEPLNFKNQRQKALHMIGALEQYMDEPTKKNMEGLKSTLSILDKFQETTNALSEKRKNGGNLDIRDMIQLIRPIIGGGNFPEAEKIDNMIRMVQIMSALEADGGLDGGGPDSDDGPVGGSASPSVAPSLSDSGSDESDDEDDDDGAFFEFVIDRYDDEDDDE